MGTTETSLFDEHIRSTPNLGTLLEVVLPVTAVLAEKTMPLCQVLELTIDSVIVFNKHNSDPVNLVVNNILVGSGKTVKVADHFGLHLRQCSPEKVVASLRP